MRAYEKSGIFLDLSGYRSCDPEIHAGAAMRRWRGLALWAAGRGELHVMEAYVAPERRSLVRHQAEQANFVVRDLWPEGLAAPTCALESAMLGCVFDACLRHGLEHVILVSGTLSIGGLANRLRLAALQVEVVHAETGWVACELADRAWMRA